MNETNPCKLLSNTILVSPSLNKEEKTPFWCHHCSKFHFRSLLSDCVFLMLFLQYDITYFFKVLTLATLAWSWSLRQNSSRVDTITSGSNQRTRCLFAGETLVHSWETNIQSFDLFAMIPVRLPDTKVHIMNFECVEMAVMCSM